jgi:peptide/nickel transport system substrate-binding protein
MVAALVVTACGGGDDDEPTAGPTATPPVAIVTPTPRPTPTAGPTATPLVVVQTATPTPQPGLAAQTENIVGFRWIQNQPNWRVPPRRGGTHNYGFNSPPASTDPIISRSFTTMTVATPIYSQLIRCAVAPNQKIGAIGLCAEEPDLATSWSISQDAKAITLKLNPNAKWHNLPQSAYGYDAKLASLYGRKVVAADVVHSVNYWLGRLKKADGSPQATVAQGPQWNNLSDARAVDEATIEITLKGPDPYTPLLLADFQSRILPPEIFQLDGDYTKRIVGSGSMMISTFDRTAKVEMNANPAFWKNGGDGRPLPYLDKHVIQVITNVTLLRSGMIGGQLDSAQTVGVTTPADAVNFGRQCTACQITELFNAKGIFSLGLKTEGANAPFDDKRARIAVAKAIDWQGIIDRIHGGAGVLAPPTVVTNLIYDTPPSVALIAEGFPNRDENPWIFDPAKAKELWAAAGKKPGEKHTIIYNEYSATITNQMLAVKGDLEKNLGIEVTLTKVADINQFYAAIGYNPGQQHQNFESMALFFNQILANPALDLQTLTPGNQANLMEYNIARINQLAAEAARGVTLAKLSEIAKEVWTIEKNEAKRFVLPTEARYVIYSGRLRNAYQQSVGGEAFHQGGHLTEVIWLAS